jgi:hypothetical protein
MQIHVSHDGKRFGPLSLEEVKARLLSGEFKPGDLAWSEGGKVDWKPLSSFPEIAGLASPEITPPLPANPQYLPTAPPPFAPETSGLAIASVICGVLSITILPCFSAIPAVICGHLAKSKINARPDLYRGEGMALAGLITGYIGLALIALLPILAGIALPVFGEVQLRGKQTKSLANAKTIATACKIYALDHNGDFPPTLDALGPEHLPDRAILICPLSGPSVPIGYDYFGGRTDDPPERILLISKAADRRGRRVVVHVDGSGAIENATAPPAVEK